MNVVVSQHNSKRNGLASQTTAKVTMSKPTSTSEPTGGSTAITEARVALEQGLRIAMEAKRETEETIKREQKELNRLLSKPIKKPSTPSSTTDLEQQIAALELERTVQSMSLGEERAILKRIHKLQTLRQRGLDFESHDQQIKQQKTLIQKTLRAQLQQQKSAVAEFETELQTVLTALELGCDVTDLVGATIHCPRDKLGKVIGKNGQSLIQLQKQTHVSVDIVRSRSRSGSHDGSIDDDDEDHRMTNNNNNTNMGVIRLLGTLKSIDAAKANLGRVLQETETHVKLPAATHYYLTSKGIVHLAQLREKHPHVRWQIQRLTEYNFTSDNTIAVTLRGVPEDVNNLRQDLMEHYESLTIDTWKLPTRESGLIVGKGGVTIAALVEKHQAAVEVKKDAVADSAVNTSDTPTTTATVTLIGPAENVTAARIELELLLAGHRDVEEIVVMKDPLNTKSVLLLQNGAGIQALHKRVNNATRAAAATTMTAGNKSNSNEAYVAISLHEQGVCIKGRCNALAVARVMVETEIQRIEKLTTTIAVDPLVIPVMIGKGGENVMILKGDTNCVNVEFDRTTGRVVVCGLDQAQVEAVVENVQATKAVHSIERICFGSINSSGDTNDFSTQFKTFLRSPVSKQVRDLVFVMSDDASCEMVLRGKPDSVQEAATLVREYLRQNYTEELIITSEDTAALLTGGKQCKIVQLAQQAGVHLNMDRDRSPPVVVARGEHGKVQSALDAVREFLYGSIDVAVQKVVLDDNDLMGVVIGKGGKQKAELEQRFTKTSMIFHRSEAAITLRGPTTEVLECHVELLKLLHGARVVRTTELTDEHVQEIQQSKFHRLVSQTVPVQVSFAPEKKQIVFRGTLLDVQEAQALLKEQLDGVRESRLPLGTGPVFEKVQAACKDPSHFARIEKQSRAKVVLDEKAHEIVVLGQRDTVSVAKEAIFQFFEFLLGPCVGRCPISDESPQRAIVTKSGFLAEVAATSGAQQVMLDRDLNVVWIVSSVEEHVRRAREMVDAKLNEGNKRMFVLKLEPSEDWIISSIIGKNGSSIKKLRRQTACTIEVDSNERKVVVSADDHDKVALAKATLEQLVEKTRGECLFFTLPDKEMPAFVGRSGSHIREFEVEHGVELQIVKNRKSIVRITGDADKVVATKLAIEAWLASREESRNDADSASQTKRLKRSQIPFVIGPKGATINSLQREFGCRVDIDRKLATVTVRGGTEEKRIELLAKVDQIISQAETEGGNESQAASLEQPQGEAQLKSESNIRTETTKETKKPQLSAAKQKSRKRESSPRSGASQTMESSEFPDLVHGGNTSAVAQVKGRWSSGEITFIGDVVEEIKDNVMELMD